MAERKRLMSAYQRLNVRKNVWKNIGTDEPFFNVHEFSFMHRVENDSKEDEDFDDMDHDGDEMEEDFSDNDKIYGPIYCSICKEIFKEPRSLAKHIIKEHCSKGRRL